MYKMNIVVEIEEALTAGAEELVYIFGSDIEAGITIMDEEAFVKFSKGVDELCEKFSEEIGKNLIFFIKQYELKPSPGLKAEFEGIVGNEALLVMMKKIFIKDIWRFQASWSEKRGWNLWRALGWARDETGYYGNDENKYKASIAQEGDFQDIQIIHYLPRESFFYMNPSFLKAKNDYWYGPIIEIYRIYLDYTHPTVEIDPIHNRTIHYNIPTNDEILERLTTGQLRPADILIYDNETMFDKQQQVVNSFLVCHTLYLQWYLTWLGLTGYTIGEIDELPEEMNTQWFIYPPIDKIPGVGINFTHSTGTHRWDDLQDDAFRAFWTGSSLITSTGISAYGWRIMNGIYSMSGHNAFEENGMEQVKSWYDINFPTESLSGYKSEMVGGTTERVPIKYKEMILNNYLIKKQMITSWFQNDDSLLLYRFLYDVSESNIDEYGKPKYKVNDEVYFYQNDYNTRLNVEDEEWALGTIKSSEGIVNGVYHYMLELPAPDDSGWDIEMYPENKIYGLKADVDQEKVEYLEKAAADAAYEKLQKTATKEDNIELIDLEVGFRRAGLYNDEMADWNLNDYQSYIDNIQDSNTIALIYNVNIPVDSIEESMNFRIGDRVWINTSEYKGWGTINNIDTDGKMYDVMDENNVVHNQVQEGETYSQEQEVLVRGERGGVIDDRTANEIVDDKIEKYDDSQLVGSYVKIQSEYDDNYNKRIGIISSIQKNNISPNEYIIQFADNDSANFLRDEFTISTKEEYDLKRRLQGVPDEDANILPVETPASGEASAYSIGDWFFKKYDFRYYKIIEKGGFPNSWKTARYNDEGIKLGGSLKMEKELDELTPKTEEELPWNIVEPVVEPAFVYKYNIDDWFGNSGIDRYYLIWLQDEGMYHVHEYNGKEERLVNRKMNESTLNNLTAMKEEELPWNISQQPPLETPIETPIVEEIPESYNYKYNVDDWFETLNGSFYYYLRIIKKESGKYKVSNHSETGLKITTRTFKEKQIDNMTPINVNDLPWKQVPENVIFRDSSGNIIGNVNDKPKLENQNNLDDGVQVEIGDPVVSPQVDLSLLINKYIALRLILLDMRNDLEYKKNAGNINNIINQYISAVNQSITIMQKRPSAEIKTQFTDYLAGYYENIQILRDSVDKLPISKDPLVIDINVPVREGSVHSLLIPIVIGGIMYIALKKQ